MDEDMPFDCMGDDVPVAAPPPSVPIAPVSPVRNSFPLASHPVVSPSEFRLADDNSSNTSSSSNNNNNNISNSARPASPVRWYMPDSPQEEPFDCVNDDVVARPPPFLPSQPLPAPIATTAARDIKANEFEFPRNIEDFNQPPMRLSVRPSHPLHPPDIQADELLDRNMNKKRVASSPMRPSFRPSRPVLRPVNQQFVVEHNGTDNSATRSPPPVKSNFPSRSDHQAPPVKSSAIGEAARADIDIKDKVATTPVRPTWFRSTRSTQAAAVQKQPTPDDDLVDVDMNIDTNIDNSTAAATTPERPSFPTLSFQQAQAPSSEAEAEAEAEAEDSDESSSIDAPATSNHYESTIPPPLVKTTEAGIEAISPPRPSMVVSPNPTPASRSDDEEDVAAGNNVQDDTSMVDVDDIESSSGSGSASASVAAPESESVSVSVSCSMTTTTASNTEVLQRRRMRRLTNLQHAFVCQHTDLQEPCKEVPHCEALKRIWSHVFRCTANKHCEVPGCSPCRSAIAHYEKCKSSKCKVCVPLRDSLPRNVAAQFQSPI